MSDEVTAISLAKSHVVTQLKHPLPHPGLSFEKHLELVKAYSVLSKEGKEAVNYKDVGKTISPFKVSGNNRFLEDLGILSKFEGAPGRYKPTTEAVDIYKDLIWNKENDAQAKIRNLVSKSWFWQTTKDLLTIGGPISEAELIQQLGRETGADPRIHTSSLRVLVSYMRFARLLTDANGALMLNKDFEDLAFAPKENAKGAEQETSTKSSMHEVSLGQLPILFGVLVQPDAPEDQIRRTIRITLEELERVKQREQTNTA